jgi:hypothetical protein
MKQISVWYGDWKDGSVILKDSKGYYVPQWNVKLGKEYKKYLKGFKPKVRFSMTMGSRKVTETPLLTF